MKNNVLKKMLMLALTAALAATPVMSVGAVSDNTTSTGTTSGSSSSSSSSGSASVAAPTTSEVKMADGTVVKSTVTGSYSAKSVQGIVVATPAAAVNAALGVAEGEQAYVTVADSNYGPQAQQCVENAAAALGTEVGPVLDIFAGKLSGGSFKTVAKAGQLVEFKVGVPANFVLKPGYELAVIRVEAGGAVTVLPNWSADASTLSFFTDSFGVFAMTQVPAGTLDNMKVAQYNQANGL